MPNSLILIGGGSRSGKSTLAKKLIQLSASSIHIDQDDYVKSQQQLSRIKNRIDWEHPSSIQWNRLITDITHFSEEYSLIIVEGIFAFCDEKLNAQARCTIYLELTQKEFFQRRSLETRWGKEPQWYLEHVWKAHQKWKNPFSITPNITSAYHEHLASQILSML